MPRVIPSPYSRLGSLGLALVIDHPSSPACASWKQAPNDACFSASPCFTPWVFMEFRDLFQDQSPDGDFRRIGCMHEVRPDGSCPRCPLQSLAPCWRGTPHRKNVHIAAGSSTLPRQEIRAILQAGDEISLDFDNGSSPEETVLAETAHILRKLRNTGIGITVSGLSTADKLRLSRLEWSHP